MSLLSYVLVGLSLLISLGSACAWVRPSLAEVSTKCFTHGTTLPPMVDGNENTRWGCCHADIGLSSADVEIVVPGSQTTALKVKFHCTTSWTLKCATTGAVLTSGSGPDTGYSASDGCYNGWVEKTFASPNCGTLLLSMTKSKYGTCHGIYDLQYQIAAPSPAPAPPSMQFVGNCFFGHRTGQQMFADGYTYGGGGGSCGNGVTGKACESKCRDGCAENEHCLAYYFIDQTKLYGANALGQCVWAFDTPQNCKAVSALNPFSSGGHQAYGNWAAMTNHFCGDASGCGWHGGKTCRSGPWTAADDAACVPSSPPNPNMVLFKKAPATTTLAPTPAPTPAPTLAPTPAPTPASMKFVGNCFFGHRTGQQMFADGYTHGGGGGSCGNGDTGKVCESKCKDGCLNNDHCIAYYYHDLSKHYGPNALGQCVWAFDTPQNCKAVSALNPFSSGGHQAYGNWAAMTNHFCGDASGCGWHGGKTCRSGPWSCADDGACDPVYPPNLNVRLFKKVYEPRRLQEANSDPLPGAFV